MAPLGLFLVLFFAAASFAVEEEAMIEPLIVQFDVDTIDLDNVTCPTIRCIRIGPPICARRKDKLVLFPTNCAFISFQCVTGKTWKKVKLEACAKKICPVNCNETEEYPVCASYGKKIKNFKSECKFRNFACKNYRKPWSRELSC